MEQVDEKQGAGLTAPWKASFELVEAVKRSDPDAMRKFFLDNLNVLKKIASCGYGEPDEFLNQFYIDLPFLNYQDNASLYSSLRRSRIRCYCGGIKTYSEPPTSAVLSYDIRISEDGAFLADILTDGITPYEETIERDALFESDMRVLQYIEKIYSDPRELNTIFCYLFTDIPFSKIEGNEYENFKSDCERLGFTRH